MIRLLYLANHSTQIVIHTLLLSSSINYTYIQCTVQFSTHSTATHPFYEYLNNWPLVQLLNMSLYKIHMCVTLIRIHVSMRESKHMLKWNVIMNRAWPEENELCRVSTFWLLTYFIYCCNRICYVRTCLRIFTHIEWLCKNIKIHC